MLKPFQVKDNQVTCWINPDTFGQHEQSFVFLHGSGGNSGAWSFQYSELHKNYNIAAVDLPGHGRSDGPGRQDIRSYVLDLKELLEVLNLKRPILTGHSLGAAIVLDFATQFPQQTGGIVAVGGGATMPVNPDIIEGFRQNPDAVLDMMVKFSLAKENRPRFYDALRDSLGQAAVEVTAGDMTACNKFDLSQAMHKIEAPTLIICGADDKMTPRTASQQLASGIPGAQLLVIEGAGHMVMMEQPAAFNQALTDFAAQLASARPDKS